MKICASLAGDGILASELRVEDWERRNLQQFHLLVLVVSLALAVILWQSSETN